MSEQSLSPITPEGKRVGLHIARYDAGEYHGVSLRWDDNVLIVEFYPQKNKVQVRYSLRTPMDYGQAHCLRDAITEAMAQADALIAADQPRKAAKTVKAIDLRPGMYVWELSEWCKVTDNWDANETGTRREITVERPGDLPPRNKRNTFWAWHTDEFAVLEAIDAVEFLTDEQWYRGQALLRHEREVRSNPLRWDEPVEADPPIPFDFGDLSPSTGYADRQCPTCGECRTERLIPTGEKPSKPVGEVIRTTSYRVFMCNKCRVVTVDSHKWVYVGDGDHDRLLAPEGMGFTIPYTDWFDKNYDGTAIASVFAAHQPPSLTPTQWKALELIAQRPGVINSAHTFHFTTGEKLVERGLVTTKQRDPYLRRYEYTITEAGREALATRRAK